MDIITVLRRAIAERIGRNRFELWFGTRTQLAVSGDRLIVSLPHPFFCDWVREHFRQDLDEVCQAIAGRRLDLVFRVAGSDDEESATADVAAASEAGSPAAPAAGVEASTGPQTGRSRRNRKRRKSQRETAASDDPPRKRAAQPKPSPRQTAKKKSVTAKRGTARRRRAAPTAKRGGGSKPPTKPEAITSVSADVAPPPRTDVVQEESNPPRRSTKRSPAPRAKETRSARQKPADPPAGSRSTKEDKKETNNKSKHSAAPRADRADKSTSSCDVESAAQTFRLVKGKDGKPRAVLSSASPRPRAGRAKLRTLATFVEGRSNQLARMGAELALQQPGQVSPLYLFGPTSVGKTHLLEGILAAASRGSNPRSTVLLTAEQFTTEFLEALRGGGLPSFRQRYRGVDVFLVDDIQFFLGKRSTINEFRYTIDTLYRAGKQIILTGDRPLAQLRELGQDLITRIESGMPCRIDPPEIETRLGIVRQLAVEMKIEVGEDICRFIASRLTNHARELAGALCRLKAAAMATRQPVSLELAQTALADLIRENKRVVRLPDIETAVCEVFGLDREALQSSRRAKRVSHPRMLAMWLARKYTRSGLAEIGHYFGNRSHSTVASAKKKVDTWLGAEEELTLNDRSWAVADAIRDIENAMQAG